MVRPRRRGRARRRRSRPEEIPDVLHPLLRLRLGRSRHDETRRVAVDGERKVMRPEDRETFLSPSRQSNKMVLAKRV